MRRLLRSAPWDADAVRDEVRAYAVDHLGSDGGVLIVDEGFRCTGRTVQVRAEVPKPPADSDRGEPAGFGRPLPGAAEIGRGFAR